MSQMYAAARRDCDPRRAFLLGRMMRITIADGLCGSGKTTAAGQEIRRLVRDNQRVMVVVPSVQLGQEIEKELRVLDPGLKVHRFDRDTMGRGRVKRKLMDHLNHAAPGQVVITTQAAFMTLPYFHHAEDWHLIVDEIPAGHQGWQLNLAETHEVITDYIEVKEDHRSNLVYHSVYAKNRAKLQEYVDNPRGDEVWKMLAPVAEAILSDHWHVTVEAGSYYGVLDAETRAGKHALFFYADLAPAVLEGFRSVTLMGALFNESILCRLWMRQGVEFEPHPEITAALRFRDHHPNGHRLRIAWGFDTVWTKSARNRDVILKDGTKRPAWETLVEATRDHFRGLNERVLFIGNIDRMSDLKEAFSDLDAEAIPHSPYGHNRYQDRHVIAVLPALNPSPHEFGYLLRHGIEPEEVRTWVYRQWVYQAANRTSLRDLDATEPVTVVVADRDTAEWLARLYPGCQVESLGIEVDVLALDEATPKRGRPRKAKALTAAERAKARRDRLNELRTELRWVNGSANGHDRLLAEIMPSVVTKSPYLISNYRDDIAGKTEGETGDVPFIEPGNFGGDPSGKAGTFGFDPLELSLFSTVYSKERNPVRVRDAESFIAILRETHRTVVQDKAKDNILLNTTVFDPALDPETDRGLRNIVSVWGLWFDVDDGDMPADFIPRHILPTTRCVVYNSHSGGNRYRIFVPTQQRMHVRSYAEILGQIVQEVEANGYVRKDHPDKTKPRHGLDQTKFTPNSLFYMPCQAKNPEESFFTDWNQARRKLMDVDAYIARSILRVPEEPIWEPDPAELAELQQHAREAKGDRVADFVLKYADEYRQIPDGAGRHAGFFRMAWRLHYACGIEINELEPYLWAADYDRSRTAGDVKSILKSLSSGRYRPHWYLDRLRAAA